MGYFSSPALANGVVYVSDTIGNLYALKASAGAVLWSYTFSADALPVVVNGVLYVGTLNWVAAFQPAGATDLFLRTWPSTTTVHQGDLFTYAFPVWNLGSTNADFEVLNTQVSAGTTFDYIRISGTPGLGTCTHPPYGGTGQIVCHENASIAPKTTWTVRLTVKVTAPPGHSDYGECSYDGANARSKHGNNTATVSLKVQ